ncbi:MAG: hypothetical protein ACRDJW_23530, partial [Thermomicrobiales bacterium]
QVRLPLATPVILAGVRTAAVLAVGTATLAAFIGAGGLGEPIVSEQRLDRAGSHERYPEAIGDRRSAIGNLGPTPAASAGPVPCQYAPAVGGEQQDGWSATSPGLAAGTPPASSSGS